VVKAKLGSHLERHGDRFRVVVSVPPSLRAHFGKAHLKETLPAGTTARPAEALKWPIVARLKGQIEDARKGHAKGGFEAEALELREALRTETPEIFDDGEVHSETEDTIGVRIDRIAETQGDAVAEAFADIVYGRATPPTAHLERWFARRKFSKGYTDDIERAVQRLAAWCREEGRAATVEAITPSLAHDYADTFIARGVNRVTANKDIAGLSSYWRYMVSVARIAESNPWLGQRLPADPNDERSKRPFTDDEAARLLTGLETRREWEFSLVAALSGMRIEEIARLTVGDCHDGWFNVPKARTRAGVRRVPIHTALAAILVKRCEGKRPDEYLFEEMPDANPSSKRTRAAAVTQAFTRARRALGIDPKPDGNRQADVDFHSWRRWFIRTAIEACESGASPTHAVQLASLIKPT
jgi:integrase